MARTRTLFRRLTHISPATIVWLLPYLALAGLLAVWCAQGLVEAEPSTLVLLVVHLVICAVITASGEGLAAVLARVADSVARRGQKVCAADHAASCGETVRPADGETRHARIGRGSGSKERLGWVRRTARSLVSSERAWRILLSLVRDALLLAGATAAATAALEVPWNTAAYALPAAFLNVELLMVGLVLTVLYFLFQRRGAGPALGVVVCAACGLVQYFVCLFKGTAILPSDVLALGTAMSVSGNYSYVLEGSALAGLALMVLGICACSLIRPLPTARAAVTATPRPVSQRATPDASLPAPQSATPETTLPVSQPATPDAFLPALQSARGFENGQRGKSFPKARAKTATLPSSPSPMARPWHRRVLLTLGNLAAAGACAYALVAGPLSLDYKADLGAKIDGWDALSSYSSQGLLTSFVAALQDMGITAPAEYSDELAVALEDAYAARYAYERGDTPQRFAAATQFERAQPSIVVVMNETFSDLSFMNGLDVGYEGPAAFNAIDDAVVRGKLVVSAYGGGTCNSEFEFLTGNSLAYVGAGKYPYTLYDLSNCDNLAAQLAELGYETTAIHPNLGTNWERDEVYAGFGFDRFLTIDDFADAPTFHSGVTDAATYEKVLDQLRTSDKPQFVFDVTMQGHSSYDQRNIDESLLRGYEPEYLGNETTAELNEYLACIDAADADLAWFMQELRALDRPVVLVFFGDHQPSFSATLNNTLFPGEGEPAHGVRTYETDYLVWTNYRVLGTQDTRIETASASTLAALALDAVGAPLSGFQAAQLGVRQDMPAVNLFAFQDANAIWHATSEAESEEARSPGFEDVGSESADLDAAARARQAFEALANIQYRTFATRVQ